MDLAAIKTGLKRLPPGFSLPETLRSAEEHYAQHAAARRSAYHELRYGLEGSLQAFLYIAGNRDHLSKFVDQCKKRGISIKKGTPLECAVIRCSYLQLSDEKVNRYANAIREAVHRNVRPDRFGKYLSQRRQGVNALHEAFKARKQQRSISLKGGAGARRDIRLSEISDDDASASRHSSGPTPKIVITCAKKRASKLLTLDIGGAISGCAIKRVTKTKFEVTKIPGSNPMPH
jgi:hypothetical protein